MTDAFHATDSTMAGYLFPVPVKRSARPYPAGIGRRDTGGIHVSMMPIGGRNGRFPRPAHVPTALNPSVHTAPLVVQGSWLLYADMPHRPRTRGPVAVFPEHEPRQTMRRFVPLFDLIIQIGGSPDW